MSTCDDGLCEVNDKLQNISTTECTCANCGKEGSDVNNTCNKCKQLRYCNAACKKKHRHKHKKQCEEHQRLAAERAAEIHDIELFKQPPPAEDCPICFLLLPTLTSGRRYKTCCGKTICSGCSYAPVYDDQGNEVDIIKQNECAFCRVVAPISDEEINEMRKKRLEVGDARAIYNIGCDYRDGTYGYQHDYTKALEYWHRAAELGFSEAYTNIGLAYYNGDGVEVDKKKATYYYELAAMRGDVTARANLGINEAQEGNMNRAVKHFMIAVRDGHSGSLGVIKQMYSNGHATKDVYTNALQVYQEYLGEIKSKQRDEAAAAHEEYRYY